MQPNELESGLSRVFAGDYRVVHLTTLEVEVDGVARCRRQRRGRAQLDSGPHGRARVGDRRRGPGRAAVRRHDLREPVGLDGLQPFERRPRAGVGARRDGGHVRRAAFAPRAPARRSARHRPRDPQSDTRRRRDRPRRRPPAHGCRPRLADLDPARQNSEASSRRSPRRPSSGATGTPSAPDSRPGSGADACAFQG